MLVFKKRYLLLTVALFIIEVLIALFLHDGVIRPYIGDLLVVILIYCFIKTFFPVKVLPAALAVLLFAYAVEGLQYLHFVKWLRLQHSKLAIIVLGNSFAWTDMLAYTVGIAIVLLAERGNAIRTFGKRD